MCPPTPGCPKAERPMRRLSLAPSGAARLSLAFMKPRPKRVPTSSVASMAVAECVSPISSTRPVEEAGVQPGQPARVGDAALAGQAGGVGLARVGVAGSPARVADGQRLDVV